MAGLTIKTQTQVRDDILRTIANGLRARGISNPNVGPASDFFATATGLATECATAQANSALSVELNMPDTAVGDALDRWLNRFGIPRQPASKSTGRGTFVSTAAATVVSGTQLIGPNNARFEVITTGVYSSGDTIDLRSLSTGTITNLSAGTVLRWVTTPAYASPTMALDANGTTGGADAEDDDTARARLLDYMADPPGSGNASQVAKTAEAYGAAIEKAFVYPAANGPGTMHVALVGPAASSITRSREVAAANVTAVTALVVGAHPEYVEIVVTSVVDSPADVSVLLQLPTTSSAGANGSNGWLDAVPFPAVASLGTKYASVTTVTTTTDITIANCAAIPTVGQTICYVDRTTFTLRTAKILTNPSNGGGGPYSCRVTLDTPLTNIATGDFIFPGAANGQAYLDALLGAFARLGAGEKISVAGLLPFAYRRPRYFESWDYTLGAKVLRAMTDAGEEVLDASWGYQNGGTTTPAEPAAITSGPKVFTPRKLAWYPAA